MAPKTDVLTNFIQTSLQGQQAFAKLLTLLKAIPSADLLVQVRGALEGAMIDKRGFYREIMRFVVTQESLHGLILEEILKVINESSVNEQFKTPERLLLLSESLLPALTASYSDRHAAKNVASSILEAAATKKPIQYYIGFVEFFSQKGLLPRPDQCFGETAITAIINDAKEQLSDEWRSYFVKTLSFVVDMQRQEALGVSLEFLMTSFRTEGIHPDISEVLLFALASRVRMICNDAAKSAREKEGVVEGLIEVLTFAKQHGHVPEEGEMNPSFFELLATIQTEKISDLLNGLYGSMLVPHNYRFDSFRHAFSGIVASFEEAQEESATPFLNYIKGQNHCYVYPSDSTPALSEDARLAPIALGQWMCRIKKERPALDSLTASLGGIPYQLIEHPHEYQLRVYCPAEARGILDVLKRAGFQQDVASSRSVFDNLLRNHVFAVADPLLNSFGQVLDFSMLIQQAIEDRDYVRALKVLKRIPHQKLEAETSKVSLTFNAHQAVQVVLSWILGRGVVATGPVEEKIAEEKIAKEKKEEEDFATQALIQVFRNSWVGFDVLTKNQVNWAQWFVENNCRTVVAAIIQDDSLRASFFEAVNKGYVNGSCAARQAIMRGHTEVFEAMQLDEGHGLADVPSVDNTDALALAVLYDNAAAFRCFNIHLPSRAQVLLNIAAYNGSVEVLEVLQEHEGIEGVQLSAALDAAIPSRQLASIFYLFSAGAESGNQARADSIQKTVAVEPPDFESTEGFSLEKETKAGRFKDYSAYVAARRMMSTDGTPPVVNVFNRVRATGLLAQWIKNGNVEIFQFFLSTETPTLEQATIGEYIKAQLMVPYWFDTGADQPVEERVLWEHALLAGNLYLLELFAKFLPDNFEVSSQVKVQGQLVASNALARLIDSNQHVILFKAVASNDGLAFLRRPLANLIQAEGPECFKKAALIADSCLFQFFLDLKPGELREVAVAAMNATSGEESLLAWQHAAMAVTASAASAGEAEASQLRRSLVPAGTIPAMQITLKIAEEGDVAKAAVYKKFHDFILFFIAKREDHDRQLWAYATDKAPRDRIQHPRWESWVLENDEEKCELFFALSVDVNWALTVQNDFFEKLLTTEHYQGFFNRVMSLADENALKTILIAALVAHIESYGLVPLQKLAQQANKAAVFQYFLQTLPDGDIKTAVIGRLQSLGAGQGAAYVWEYAAKAGHHELALHLLTDVKHLEKYFLGYFHNEFTQEQLGLLAHVAEQYPHDNNSPTWQRLEQGLKIMITATAYVRAGGNNEDNGVSAIFTQQLQSLQSEHMVKMIVDILAMEDEPLDDQKVRLLQLQNEVNTFRKAEAMRIATEESQRVAAERTQVATVSQQQLSKDLLAYVRGGALVDYAALAAFVNKYISNDHLRGAVEALINSADQRGGSVTVVKDGILYQCLHLIRIYLFRAAVDLTLSWNTLGLSDQPNVKRLLSIFVKEKPLHYFLGLEESVITGRKKEGYDLKVVNVLFQSSAVIATRDCFQALFQSWRALFGGRAPDPESAYPQILIDFANSLGGKSFAEQLVPITGDFMDRFKKEYDAVVAGLQCKKGGAGLFDQTTVHGASSSSSASVLLRKI